MVEELNVHIGDWAYPIIWTISVFGTALNLFGFFVIIRYSPKEMREYSHGLINLQFASTLCDHLMADAAAPFLLFPIFGGIPMGWMHHLGISSEIHSVLCLSAIGHTQTASVCLFFARFQLILPVGHALKCSTRFLHVFFIVMSLSSYLQISGFFYAIHETNGNKTREYYRENYPELGQFINLDTFDAIPPNSVSTALLTVIPFMLITAGMMFGFSFGCFYSLRQQASIMEMRLIKEEKKLIHALIIQVTVPVLLSFTPLTAFAAWPKLAINSQITKYFPLMTLILSKGSTAHFTHWKEGTSTHEQTDMALLQKLPTRQGY
ncbi:unnamed protein product, partial [Mesorhabditis belari]|uniref:G protein-coupled receptor n=1 Tax=Mesorhabditis belari TaxID=2138241 RepID=A0AAF3FCH5_9BILA